MPKDVSVNKRGSQ